VEAATIRTQHDVMDCIGNVKEQPPWQVLHQTTSKARFSNSFFAPSPSPVTVTAIAIYDAATVGNLLYWCDLTSSQTVANGNVVSVAAAALSISLT
jgi:hypothetical protein